MGFRGSTSRRSMGWVNSKPISPGLLGAPVGTSAYALEMNGFRPVMGASAPAAVNNPHLISSRREICPQESAWTISRPFLPPASASLSHVVEEFPGKATLLYLLQRLLRMAAL